MKFTYNDVCKDDSKIFSNKKDNFKGGYRKWVIK